jgi:hypothetical protein
MKALRVCHPEAIWQPRSTSAGGSARSHTSGCAAGWAADRSPRCRRDDGGWTDRHHGHGKEGTSCSTASRPCLASRSQVMRERIKGKTEGEIHARVGEEVVKATAGLRRAAAPRADRARRAESPWQASRYPFLRRTTGFAISRRPTRKRHWTRDDTVDRSSEPSNGERAGCPVPASGPSSSLSTPT